MENSKIEWTDNTFNPWIGCTRVSPGCQHCYAETLMDQRYGRVKWGPQGTRQRTSEANWKKPLQWNRQAEKEGRRIKVFCASLADVFEDNEQLIDWRLDLFEQLIAKTPNLDWLILTKRPNIAFTFFRVRRDLCLPNIRMGVSIEDQKRADERREVFRLIPIESKFVSYEPALGPVDWAGWEFIDWLICGGESGPGARPMYPQWARQARDWAIANNVAYHFKQWGEYLPVFNSYTTVGGYNFEKVGKHAAGRELDGRTWNEFPAKEQSHDQK
jgi:protein gp37